MKRKQNPPTFSRLISTGLLALLLNAFTNGRVLGATAIDETKLPSPATNHIEFARDIKPIFQQSCLKCHGPEKPKSKFRLDNRESALKGGNNGVDIISGDSAKSPLIHNVAGLVEDMEMPPKGKAEPVTPEQIGLLRAWIDQGAVWETQPPESLFFLSLSPTVGWTTVSGDEHKFREHYWIKEGWNGGAENFLLTDKFGKESKLTVEGHALVDDYRVALTLEKKEVGFTRFGWEHYRKYFDDTGGYFPDFTPSAFSLGRDLHLDVGRAWADFGLTLPDWPRMVIGYEYQYRDGEKSTLQWGAVKQDGETRNIYPSAKAIDEHVHIIKFDLDHEIAGVRIADSFRGEFYDLHTQRQGIRLNESFIVSSNAPSGVDVVKERQSYFQGANTFRLERAFTDWFFGSAGYLYSKLNADAAFSLDTLYPLGIPASLNRAFGDLWRSEADILERETHAFNLSGLLGPWQGFNLSVGLLNEWTREKELGRLTQDSVNRFGTVTPHPATFDGDLDKAMFEESLALRYTTIPFTVLFAEARLQQESIGQFQEEVGGPQAFLRQTDATGDRSDFRAGFTTSPWQRVSLSAHYRHYQEENDYDHLRDDSAHGPGYPAFIRWRDVDIDEVETKLVVRPCNWLKTTLTYKYVSTEYQTATDPVSESNPNDISPGGRLESADYAAQVYSLNATVTPWRRLYLSGTFSYEHSRTAAFANDTPAVVPYRGDRFSVLTSGNYAWNRDTDLQAGYSFSWADYGQNNYADGLPLGMNYQQHALTTGVTRRFGKNIAGKLQYGFFYYDDPGSGGANNYTAHAVFVTLTVRLP